MYGIAPDLTVLGKIIGGGFPIGAVGGSRPLMQRLAPEGDVYQAGTFAGHPIAMAAGLATLEALKRQRSYAALDRRAARLAEGLKRAASQSGVPVQINRAGSMLTVFFSAKPVARFADVQAADAGRFSAWANAMRARGVLVPPSPFETLFVSTMHADAVITQLIRVSAEAYAKLASPDS